MNIEVREEQVDPAALSQIRLVSAQERTRRGLLYGMAAGFSFLFLLQIGFAVYGGDAWERTGPIFTNGLALVAAGLGYAWAHYFPQ
jgi:hypothetical protein